MSWTTERVEILRSLWAEGKSAKEIAEKLNGVTRSAVLGKLHREGWATREKGYRRAPNGQRKARKPKTSGYSVLRRLEMKAEKARFNEPEILQPDFLGITIDQLDDTTCRFPRGDRAPYLFCGQITQKDSSYCQHCHRIAYSGIPERPERKGFARSFAFGGRAA